MGMKSRWEKKDNTPKEKRTLHRYNTAITNDNSSSSSSSSSSEDKSKRREYSDSTESEFALFWSSYPIKEGKRDALKAFNTLRKTVPLDEIAQAFNGYMDFLKAERVHNNFERRPKLAATFLRNDRWREYIGYEYRPTL